MTKNNNLTCVMIGFYINWDLNELIQEPSYRHCCNNDYGILLNNFMTCEKIECLFEEIEKQNSFQSFDYYELLDILSKFEFIFEFIVQPLISIFGIFINVLVIYILKLKKNSKDFKERMYFYIIWNSVFNLSILFLNSYEYFYKCSLNGYGYCPIIRETSVVQYLFISINFLQEFFGFCSNFTMLFFSIERYIFVFNDISKKKLKVLKFFERKFFSILICETDALCRAYPHALDKIIAC